VLLMFITISRMYTAHPITRIRWIAFALGNLLAFLVIFLAGTWAYLSFYVRWIFLVAYVAAWVFSARRLRDLPWHGEALRVFFWFVRVVNYFVFGALLWFYISGGFYGGRAVNMSFPYRHGHYYIMQGGNSILTNFFHRSYDIYTHSRFDGFAMDIGRLNRWGARAAGISPVRLSDYAIYGDTVLSPVDGEIIQCISSVSQNRPGHFNTDSVHGNHVIIQAQDFRLILGHLQTGKVFVRTGDIVRVGTPIGLTGNSGFSAEPHLHINALVQYDSTNLYSGVSVPILFDGRFYELNDRLRRK
jgi:hypothetical protein